MGRERADFGMLNKSQQRQVKGWASSAMEGGRGGQGKEASNSVSSVTTAGMCLVRTSHVAALPKCRARSPLVQSVRHS